MLQIRLKVENNPRADGIALFRSDGFGSGEWEVKSIPASISGGPLMNRNGGKCCALKWSARQVFREIDSIAESLAQIEWPDTHIHARARICIQVEQTQNTTRHTRGVTSLNPFATERKQNDDGSDKFQVVVKKADYFHRPVWKHDARA